ncbi:uncharacterized protein UV8b_05881 [Ustilaginoidea virens]|uniref:Kazal-like domain-containing protein n=1 Tax=Ustilaginoidea virens TaxID=1159556 RepID=A0A8E5HUN4_USTVR|nr:uncharacterized protein UV8b_05881 [Ustilaginoidea virens]QUC21638.1 hypothetical protein UV8b_05881 [Ustilaginoidea virens]
MKSWFVVLALAAAAAHASPVALEVIERSEPCIVNGNPGICTAYTYPACNAPGTKLTREECVELCANRTARIVCSVSVP